MAVIGRGGRRIAEADALAHVLGYTCANDVSHRPIQFAEMKMGTLLVGKAFDTFCPLGPVIATGLDPARLDIATRLNGPRVPVEQHHATCCSAWRSSCPT